MVDTLEAPVEVAPAKVAPKRKVAFRLTFTKGRETKGAVVFDEAAAPEHQHRKIRTVYLRKEAFEELGAPEKIAVMISAIDA